MVDFNISIASAGPVEIEMLFIGQQSSYVLQTSPSHSFTTSHSFIYKRQYGGTNGLRFQS